MTDTEIRAAFQEEREAIEYDEKYLVRFIRGYLLTDEQKWRLVDLNLDVADLCNGRFPIAHSAEIHSWFATWNRRLGQRYFLE